MGRGCSFKERGIDLRSSSLVTVDVGEGFVIATLDIILVNRNSGSQLRECIQSINTLSKDKFRLGRVVIVDDVSTDSSLDNLDGSTLPLVIMKNRRRSGYGASCNRGAAGSDADFLLFLNTDTRLVSNSIDVPIAFMTDPANQNFKVVGIKLLRDPDTVARGCSRFPTPGLLLSTILGLDRVLPRLFRGPAMTEWHHLDSRPVDQVIGAFLLICRKLFEEVGGYDERFFVYYEDLDLSFRARRLGFRNMYLSTSHAYHVGGGTARKYWAESLFFNRQSRIRYARKHFSPVGALTVALATLLIEPFVRTCFAAVKRSHLELSANWSATWRLWCTLLNRCDASSQNCGR